MHKFIRLGSLMLTDPSSQILVAIAVAFAFGIYFIGIPLNEIYFTELSGAKLF